MNRINVVMAIFLFATSAFADEGRDIMAKYEEATKLPLIKSDATLTNKEVNGEQKFKKFTWWRKIQPDNVHYRTLTHFYEPAEIRGEQILFVEHEGDKADVLLYLPAYKKTRRVERQSQSKSFMSSEFSYADIAKPHIDDFSYKKLKDESCANGISCFVVETTPKTDEVRERTGYGRSRHWIRKDNYTLSKAEHFNFDNQLIKSFAAEDTLEVDPSHHRWMSMKLEMTNVKTGRRTTIEFSHVNIKDAIPDAKFSPQNLGRN